MTVLTTQLPTRRTDLVIRPIGEGGRYVVKIPGTNDYFHLGEEEHFLLLQLDGKREIGECIPRHETPRQVLAVPAEGAQGVGQEPPALV